MNLFQRGDFKLHSGANSDFKIEMDALADEDVDTIAYLVAKRFNGKVDEWRAVEGIPRGGLRFAAALKKYVSLSPHARRVLIADDVLTSGGSMEAQRAGREDVAGVVIFARGSCPAWVTPVFQMWGRM